MLTYSSETHTRPTPFLVLEGVAAGYGGPPVVHEISLGVGLGEVVSIVGPNGAGKSTLLKAIVGALPVTSGHVRLGDQTVTNYTTDRLARMGVGYVPQLLDVFAPLTVLENLRMGGYLLPRQLLPSRIEEVVTVFPALKSMMTRTAGKLSGGERKMLAVARVLMLSPKLLVIDEPTANLANELALSLLRDHVRRLADEGTGVLLVEQRVRAALDISDWSHVVVSGRTRLTGTPDELTQRPDFAQIFLGAPEAQPESDQNEV